MTVRPAVGAGTLAMLTAQALATPGHEVVVVETDRFFIDCRDEESLLPDKGKIIRDGDDTVVLSHGDNRKSLRQRRGLRTGEH